MTPKEKASNLVDNFLDLDNYNNLNLDLFCDECGMSNEAAKICALISVDEIIKSNPCYEDSDRGGNFIWNDNTYYWQEVKQEIEKL